MTISERQHEIDRQRIMALENELDEARERIRQLEADNGMGWMAPIELGLTRSESAVLGILLARDETVSKEALLLAMYSDRIDEPPHIKIVDVFICKLRRKIAPFGLGIDTRWGIGYLLTPASRVSLNSWGVTPQAVSA